MRTLYAALFGLAIGLVVLFAPASEAQAARRPQKQNPFSSFNISGINYGSQQWAKSQAKSSSGRSTSRGFRFR
ncbi:MAG: hypothetical protein KF708_00370 [Pirellulales bacterium]|nr:hypothetical protein [Pirellulales bacterium]